MSDPLSAAVSGPPGSAGVAAGSREATDAAVAMLAQGGNAVDAALAAAFAGVMSEPVLTSLGGGGFLLHAAAGQQPDVLDFFVAIPGIDSTPRGVAHVDTVIVDFAKAGPAASTSEQVFHGGWGTVATPGCFAGYLDAHATWGSLDIGTIIGPARDLASNGVDLAPIHRRFVTLVYDLLMLTPDSQRLFGGLDDHGRYVNAEYAALLDAIASGEISDQTSSAYALPLVHAAESRGGLITVGDIDRYRSITRSPLVWALDDVTVWTNPPPSFGGSIITDALTHSCVSGRRLDWARVAAAQFDATMRGKSAGNVSTGTTHISVIDATGSIAAITASNGSGSGTVVPGWGVALNNMLGEEDLHTDTPLLPGERMRSMMSPTIIDWSDGTRAVMGTGGSERIRSALIDVLARVIVDDASLADAIASPRVHVSERGHIHLEPGLSDDDVRELAALAEDRGWPDLEMWPQPNVFFGGVHAVQRGRNGSIQAIGDTRRAGAAAVVTPNGEVRRTY